MIFSKVNYFCFLVVLITSCVSNKKLIYLQDLRTDIAKSEAEIIKTFLLKDSEYRLKANDRITIRIFSLTQEKFNFFGSPEIETKIDNEGQIELPVIGHVSVKGLTIPEIEEKLKTLTVDYLKSPTISVKLISFNFTVLGEVNNQGALSISDTKINLLEAIGRAGGLTDFADRSNIRVIRHENGEAKIYKLNILKDNILLSEQYYLQPNDIIVIDPLKAKNARQNQLNIVSLVVSLTTSLSLILFQFLN